MRYLASIALFFLCFSQVFAQDRLLTLDGTHKTPEGNQKDIVLIFDRVAGLYHYTSQDSLGNVVYKIGEYDYDNRKLTTKWLTDNTIEVATLKMLENADVEYQVLSNSRQPNQKFSAIKLRRIQTPKEIATSTIQLGDTYLLKKNLDLQKTLDIGQSFMQLQHEFNMRNLENSKEFGRSLSK